MIQGKQADLSLEEFKVGGLQILEYIKKFEVLVAATTLSKCNVKEWDVEDEENIIGT